MEPYRSGDRIIVAAWSAGVERGVSVRRATPGQRHMAARSAELQAFRDLAPVEAEVMRDAPVECYCRKVGAAAAFVFKP